jgi:hypothetical protein
MFSPDFVSSICFTYFRLHLEHTNVIVPLMKSMSAFMLHLHFAEPVKNVILPLSNDRPIKDCIPKKGAIYPMLKFLGITGLPRGDIFDPHFEKRPFSNLPEKRRTMWALTAEEVKECRWLKPRRVAQIEFTEWTSDGHLRHPSFIGRRDDKDVRMVVREKPISGDSFWF